MKRMLIAGAAAAAGVAVAIPLTAGAQSSGPRTFTLTERDDKTSTFHFVDTAPRNKRPSNNPVVSPGDYFVFSGPLYDASNARVGRIQVQCVATSEHKRINQAQNLCTGVLSLKDGKIALTTAVVGNPKKVTAAITGGTGAYAGARGQFDSTSTKSGSVDTLTLQ